MTERSIAAKEVLFRQGEAAEVAYLIRSGSVEVVRHKEGQETRVAEIGAGEVVGEMALFDLKHQHTATVRAISDTLLETITAQDLEEELNKCPARIRPVLESVFRRLRVTSQRITEKEAPAAVLSGDVEKVILLSDSAEVNSALEQPVEVALTHLPFRIGGYQKDEDITHRRKGTHLSIPSEGPPLSVSLNHCEIVLQEESLYLVDLGSRFGTTVNDISIGRGKGVYKAPLQKGENLITLGERKTSPYKLKVVCV